MEINKKFLVPFLVLAILFLLCGATSLGSYFMPDTISKETGDIGAIGLVLIGFALMVVTLRLVGQKRKRESGTWDWEKIKES